MAQILWTFALIIEDPLFGSKTAEDWSINIPYKLVFNIWSNYGLKL